jgi:hypothetical protein
MNKINNWKLMLVIFILLFTISLIYFFYSPYQFPVATFWILISLWISFVIYQINKTESDEFYILGLLSIIFLAIFVLILMRPYGINPWGVDSYLDCTTAKYIYMDGWEPRTLNSFASNSSSKLVPAFLLSDYPLIHIYVLISSIILNSDLLFILAWITIPLLFCSFLFIFIISNSLYRSRRIALICCFILFMFWGFYDLSSYPKQLIALQFYLIIIYIYLFSKPNQKSQYAILAILLFFAITLAHHLTSWLLIFFFLSNSLITIIRSNGKSYINLTFLLLLFVCVIGYWIYLQYSPIEWISRFFETQQGSLDIQSNRPIFTQSTSFRYALLKTKDIFSGLILGFLSVYTILLRRHEVKSIELNLLFFGGVMGVLTLLLTQFVTWGGRGTLWGGRFMLFGYFALATLSAYSLSSIFNSKRGILHLLVVLFLASYAIFQIYCLPPSLYIHTLSPNELDSGKFYLSPSEVNGFTWNKLNNGTLSIPDWAYKIVISLNLYKYNRLPHVIVIPEDALSIQKKLINISNYVIFVSDNLAFNSTYEYNSRLYLLKVYSSKKIEIYNLINRT